MGCHRFLHNRTLMPRRIVYDDDHVRMALCRVGSGHIVQMSRKGHLEPSRFALTGLPFDPSGLFQQSGGEFATGDIEGGVAIHHILIIPGPYHRPMPFDPEGSSKRWGQWKARFILTEQHALAELGFFLTRRSLLEPFVACRGRL